MNLRNLSRIVRLSQVRRYSLPLALALSTAACGSTSNDDAVAIPGADDPPSTTAPAELGSDTTTATTARTSDQPIDTTAPETTPAAAAGGGDLGFVEVDGDRYTLIESGYCFIDDATGSTGAFLGRNQAGRTGVLAIEGDPEVGEAVIFELDVASLALGDEAPETSPQYEARNQEVLLIGELAVEVTGGTFAGTAVAAEVNGSSGFEPVASMTFSATCG